MKIFKYILFSCLLALAPMVEADAQAGLLKIFGRGARTTGRKVVKKSTQRALRSASTRTARSASQRAAMIKRVSRSKSGMEVTRRARSMAHSCFLSNAVLDRAALRVTEKLVAKGGEKALKNVTTEQLYQMVTKEVAAAELRAMGQYAIVGVPYVAWRHTQDGGTSNTNAKGNSTKSKDNHIDNSPLPELNSAAITAAGNIFGTSKTKVEMIKKDASANLRLKMAIEDNPELLDAYNRCANSSARTDVTILNYLTTRAKLNDQLLSGTSGAALKLENEEQDENIVNIFINNQDKVAAEMISKGYAHAQLEGSAYYFNMFIPEMQDLRPMPNSEIVTDKGRRYVRKWSKTYVYAVDNDADSKMAYPTFNTDQHGRVVKFRYLFTKDDVCEVAPTAKMQTISQIILTTDARGKKTIDKPAKGFVSHSIHPLWLGGKETWLNTVAFNKKSEKAWQKSEKNLQKLLKNKKINAVWYEVVLTYDNAVTQTPSSVKVLKEWYHNSKGIQKEEDLINTAG